MNKNTKSKKIKIIGLSGLSAVGKDTIRKIFEERGFNNVVSYTTRPKRDNEVEGVDYHFTSNRHFCNLIDLQQFIEHRMYTTTYNNEFAKWYYGVPKSAFNNNFNKYVIVADYEGISKLQEYFKDNFIHISVEVDSEIRKQRAKQRGNFCEIEWERRLKDDTQKYMSFNLKTDYIIDNNSDLGNIKKQVDKILSDIFKEEN